MFQTPLLTSVALALAGVAGICLALWPSTRWLGIGFSAAVLVASIGIVWLFASIGSDLDLIG